MGGVSRGFGWWWDYIKSVIHIDPFTITGSIVLGPGLQEIEIPTQFNNPQAIYLSTFEPDGSVTTCIGDLNWVAARLLDSGFVLYANINSSSCQIDYVVKYDPNRSIPTNDTV